MDLTEDALKIIEKASKSSNKKNKSRYSMMDLANFDNFFDKVLILKERFDLSDK